MAAKWQQIRRRRRQKFQKEVMEPVDEVSTEKQLQIIQRVHMISHVLQDSLLLNEALNGIASHFKFIPAQKTLMKDEFHEKDVNHNVLMIIGYGLGSFCASSNAVHQLGFLVALKRALDEKFCSSGDAKVSKMSDGIPHGVEIYDPAMNKSDAFIAEQFQLKVIQENEHARRHVVCNTVFFMPHCDKVLYENVLACNWGPAMKKLVIIGNSFSAYGDRVLAAEEREQLLLVSVLPYLEEVHLSCGVSKIHQDFARYETAFNDLSVHRFPPDLLDRALKTDKDLIARMAAVTSSIGRETTSV
ncbi:hypothetical protein KXD40_000880 [Peronospora effusa]|uniref:SRR1-like domain-containing protein n=1 Tax=Peronospora effusa TaxID=542832 RepID=A0A3M6VSU3_9STRA|nr:hypothetical protein DD238_003570 [Peronospora effusa]UIZ20715.1 hypothetical protein KXD40_000880 [Peronospora effusa]